MKNVIITGASQGIGRALSLAFAEKGHSVLTLSRNLKKLQSLQKEAENLDGKISILKMDIAKDLSLEKITAVFPKIDILINNAGKLVNKPFEEISVTELREVYETNVFAPYVMVQKLLPHFSENAHLINIGSVGGVTGTQKFAGLSAYSSSKAAFGTLAECWQAELGGRGLAFNTLALGAVQTEMLEQAFPDYQAPVSPEEMAEFIMEFALNGHKTVRGQVVNVARSNP